MELRKDLQPRVIVKDGPIQRKWDAFDSVEAAFNAGMEEGWALSKWEEKAEAAHEDAHAELFKLFPAEQIEAVFSQPEVDIDSSFLGFVDVYRNLSRIIPEHFTVIDLGCAYNPQCFFFAGHKEYVAVDVEQKVRFMSPNCTFYQKTISAFISEDLKRFDLSETFAICSYVPPWYGHDSKVVRETFRNLFVYYPHGGYSPILNFRL